MELTLEQAKLVIQKNNRIIENLGIKVAQKEIELSNAQDDLQTLKNYIANLEKESKELKSNKNKEIKKKTKTKK